MFRKRAAEILHCGLKSQEELDTTKEVERLLVVPIEPLAINKNSLLNNPPELGSCGVIDSAVVEALSADFNPSNPF